MIKLQNIYKIYVNGDNTTYASNNVNINIKKGEFVAIVGQSGSGKSTIMNIIGCLDVPTSGTYLLNDIDVSTMDDNELAEIRNKMLGFIFQQYNLIQKLNVQENVELPLLYAGYSAEERHELASLAIKRVGLEGKEKNFSRNLDHKLILLENHKCPKPGEYIQVKRVSKFVLAILICFVRLLSFELVPSFKCSRAFAIWLVLSTSRRVVPP